MSRARARLKGRLGAALALGTAAAIPTVVAFSEEPRALQGTAWAPSSGGGRGGESAAEQAAAGPWPLSRVVEQALEAVQRWTAAETGEGGDDVELETREALQQAAPPAASTSSEQAAASAGISRPGPATAVRGHAGAADAAAGQLQVEAGRQGRQHVKWRRAHSVSPSLLAEQHPDDVARMRQLAAAELSLIQRKATAAAADAGPQQQQHEQHGSARGGSQAGTAGGHVGAAAAAAEAASQLPPRFDGAELMRFAVSHGLLRAASPAERDAALRGGAAAAARTAAWLAQHPFAGDEELARFAHLVHWRGTDPDGRPVLRIAIGHAVSECRGPAALAFAEAVVAHVERGVREKLRGSCRRRGNGDGTVPAAAAGQASAARAGPSGLEHAPSSSLQHSQQRSVNDAAPAPPLPLPDSRPEQIVVVMDCSGASALNAARISRLFQSVAATLNQHYPGRLHELVLLDLPVVLSWMVQGIKKLVHPDTRGKLRVARHDDAPAAAAHTSAAVLAAAPSK